jgi:hypothetical protein
MVPMKRALPAASSLFLLLACSSSSNKSGPSDAATDAPSDAPPACSPAPLGSWMPPPYAHAASPRPSACPPSFIVSYYEDCLGPNASNSGCNATWYTGADLPHATCVACLVTKSTSTQWGPIIDYGGGTLSMNVAGCIELLDPQRASCAMAVQQADECPHQACDTACPVNPNDQESFTKWQSCQVYADQNECSTFEQAGQCEGSEDAGPAAACVVGMSFQDLYNAIAPVFCGSVSADGGGG